MRSAFSSDPRCQSTLGQYGIAYGNRPVNQALRTTSFATCLPSPLSGNESYPPNMLGKRRPTQMAWHPTHPMPGTEPMMDGMHVLIGSVPGMRRPLTGCPCFYPWLHVTVLNSTGKCTQPPCVFERHSLLHPTATLPFSSPELSAVCKNPERKASGHETRLGGRMVGGQTRTRRCHVRLRSVHNVYVPFGKAVPGDGRRNAGPEVGLKKRPLGPGTQALRGRAKTAGQG